MKRNTLNAFSLAALAAAAITPPLPRFQSSLDLFDDDPVEPPRDYFRERVRQPKVADPEKRKKRKAQKKARALNRHK